MRIPSVEEIKYALAEERAEKANVLDMLRDTNALNAKLAKELEQAVHWMDEARDASAELELRVEELTAERDVARGERDTANAQAQVGR